ncbi:neprilysin-1-like [Uranotaenia lowii]|uniref:neprilysin-1-like n=1 Tax=Uranotaenia lowii TaxID=190385 RepID=UPI002479DDA1|nr:neprilysin-1-like [Uranotaenia lowii]
MDLTVDPCEDFYQYTCGKWDSEHPRPDSYTSYDWFTERQARVLRNIRTHLQRNSSSSDPKPVVQSRILYQACMNLSAMDKAGYKPVFDMLKQLDLPSYPTILNVTKVDYEGYSFDWVQSLARVEQLLGLDIMFGFEITPDPRDRDFNRLVLGSPETNSDLPFNSILLKNITRIKHRLTVSEDGDPEDDDPDEEDSQLTKAYKKFMVEVMKILVNSTNSKLDVESISENFDKAASVYIKMSESLMKIYNLADNASRTNNTEDRLNLDDIVYLNVNDLQNITDSHLAPREPLPIWEHYLNKVFDGLPEAGPNFHDDQIMTSSSDIYYLKLLVDYLSKTPLVHIELFIWWTVVEELILHTTSEIRRLHSDYYRATVSVEGFTTRTLYCTGAVNKLMGMAVSYAISDQHFLQNTKPKVEAMLRYIQEAFERLVRDTTWMDWKTKRSTLEKSRAMRSLIGFPEWILEPKKLEEFYDKVEVRTDQHLANMVQIVQLRNINKLRKWRLKNTLSWETVPTNVNAFHTFQDNAITIPIAILQYPFYHRGLE